LRHCNHPFALALVLALAACGDSPTDPLQVGSIVIEAPATMGPGAVVQATATVLDADGDTLQDHPVAWSSSDEAIATVDGDGLITALAEGAVTISASAHGVTGSVEVDVDEDFCAPVGTIEPGATVEGELTGESCLIEEWFTDLWLLELTTETIVQIDLTSADFDAALILWDELGNQFGLNEGPGDARLSGTLPAGNYVIGASTTAVGEVGVYELSVVEETDTP
jgi:hypothetical protein